MTVSTRLRATLLLVLGYYLLSFAAYATENEPRPGGERSEIVESTEALAPPPAPGPRPVLRQKRPGPPSLSDDLRYFGDLGVPRPITCAAKITYVAANLFMFPIMSLIKLGIFTSSGDLWSPPEPSFVKRLVTSPVYIAKRNWLTGIGFSILLHVGGELSPFIRWSEWESKVPIAADQLANGPIVVVNAVSDRTPLHSAWQDLITSDFWKRKRQFPNAQLVRISDWRILLAEFASVKRPIQVIDLYLHEDSGRTFIGDTELTLENLAEWPELSVMAPGGVLRVFGTSNRDFIERFAQKIFPKGGIATYADTFVPDDRTAPLKYLIGAEDLMSGGVQTLKNGIQILRQPDPGAELEHRRHPAKIYIVPKRPAPIERDREPAPRQRRPSGSHDGMVASSDKAPQNADEDHVGL